MYLPVSEIQQNSCFFKSLEKGPEENTVKKFQEISSFG